MNEAVLFRGAEPPPQDFNHVPAAPAGCCASKTHPVASCAPPAGAAAAIAADGAAAKRVSRGNATTFHRRKLPAANIAFSSARGQQMFKEALVGANDSGMGCFFRLIEQFRTQDDPAFCGLSTLTMVLNALNVDPGKTWKGPWRWFHENMLDCCEPIEAVREKGITWPKFVCLARCNGLFVEEFRCFDDSNLEAFRMAVLKVAKQDADSHETEGDSVQVVVISYSRKVLGQTGDGHYSPIGGYHRDSDGNEHVLILDVARFKYPPHWVPLQTVYEAMTREDPDTGKARGFMLLKRKLIGGWLTLTEKEPGISESVSSGQLKQNGGIMCANEVPGAFADAVGQNLQASFSSGHCVTSAEVAREAFELVRKFCKNPAMPLTVMCYEAVAREVNCESPASAAEVTGHDEREHARAGVLASLARTADCFARELGLEEKPEQAHPDDDDCGRVMSPAELETAELLMIPMRLWEEALPVAVRHETMELLRAAGLDEGRLEEGLRPEVEMLRYQFHVVVNRNVEDACSC